jgi:hypothetical protein
LIEFVIIAPCIENTIIRVGSPRTGRQIFTNKNPKYGGYGHQNWDKNNKFRLFIHECVLTEVPQI